jgi:hypothetical protein
MIDNQPIKATDKTAVIDYQQITTTDKTAMINNLLISNN